MKRQWYGVILGAVGLVVLLGLAGGSSMLRLVGVLLILAGLAIALLRHQDDAPTPPATGAGADETEDARPASRPDDPR